MSSPISGPVLTPSRSQRLQVKGEELLAKVRELIHQGNVRRIHVIGEDGASILEIPLTAGVIGAIVAPVLVAVGAIAALAKNYTLLIEAHAPREATPVKRTPPQRHRSKRQPA
ncbi:MAG: DUF4342 domain-containing protein [Gemmatimonadota bacterium]